MKKAILAAMMVVAAIVLAGCPVPVEVTIVMPTPNQVIDTINDVWTPPTEGEGEGEVVPTEGEGEGEVVPTEGEGEGEVIPTEGEGEGEVTEGEGEGEATEGEGEGEVVDCDSTEGLKISIDSALASPGGTVRVLVSLNRPACSIGSYGLDISILEGEGEITEWVCGEGEYDYNIIDGGNLLISSVTWRLRLDDDFAEFRVKIPEDATGQIVIGWNETTVFYDDWGNPIDVTLVNGVINIK